MFQNRSQNLGESLRRWPLLAVVSLFLAVLTLALVFEVWITPGFAYGYFTPQRAEEAQDAKQTPQSTDPYQQLIESAKLPTNPLVNADDERRAKLVELSSAEEGELMREINSHLSHAQQLDKNFDNEYLTWRDNSTVPSAYDFIAELEANSPYKSPVSLLPAGRRRGDYGIYKQLRDKLPGIIAQSSSRPGSEIAVQEIRKEAKEIDARHEQLVNTRNVLSGSIYVLENARDHLSLGELTVGDFEDSDSAAFRINRYGKLLGTQRIAIEDFEYRIKKSLSGEGGKGAERKKTVVSIESLVPAGAPAFNPDDPYQYLDSRYAKAYEEFNRRYPNPEAKQQYFLDRKMSEEKKNDFNSDFSEKTNKAVRILATAINRGTVNLSDLVSGFQDCHWAEEVKAVEELYKRTYQRDLHQDLLYYIHRYERDNGIGDSSSVMQSVEKYFRKYSSDGH